MGLMAELAFREAKAAEERAERHRRPEEGTDPPGAHAGDDDGERECFAPAAARHRAKQEGQGEPAHQEHRRHRQQRPADGQRHRVERRLSGQDRYEQEQGDDAQVLEQQDADDKPAVRRVELVAAAELLQNDRRARKRDEQPGEHRQRQRPIRHDQDDGDDDRGSHSDLQDPRADHATPDPPEIAEREVQADREQQEDDADFGEQLDVLLRRHDADAAGARDRSGRDQGDDRRNAQAGEGDDEDEGERVGEDELAKQRVPEHSVLSHLQHLEQLDWKREDDRRVLLGRNLRQRLEISERNRHRLPRR